MTIDLGPLAVDAAAGTWDRLSGRLSVLVRRHADHYCVHGYPWAMTHAYFVGGPLDGEVRAIEARYFWPGVVYACWGGPAGAVGYRLSRRPLPTGLPVFTCLATD